MQDAPGPEPIRLVTPNELEVLERDMVAKAATDSCKAKTPNLRNPRFWSHRHRSLSSTTAGSAPGCASPWVM